MKAILFTAPWCSACKDLKPFVEATTSEAGVPLEIADVSEEWASVIADQYGVRGLPSVVIESDTGGTVELLNASTIKPRLKEALL
jgi:thioredoxin 1